MGILWIIALLVTSLLLLVWFLTYRDRKYFESRGIPYLGNALYSFLYITVKGISQPEHIMLQYKQMKEKNQKLTGSNDFGKTALTVIDLTLLKHIFIKDFEHFTDRRSFAAPKNDKLLNKMLFSLEGEKWKLLRSKMSPTFTTGKIKRMFAIFDESSKKFAKFIEQRVEDAGAGGQIDLQQSFSKYTMDVIASTACGLDSKAFEQLDMSLFEHMGTKLQLKFEGLELVKILFITLFPKIADIFGLSFLGLDVQNFFSGAIKSSMKLRKDPNQKRDDFIQLLLEAREGKLKTDESELNQFEKDAMMKDGLGSNALDTSQMLDDDGIVAQCVLFIFGGFDSTQNLLMFTAYALALNPEVQDKLRTEILKALEENDGEYTYDSINKITYLDMFINETLRIYPPTLETDRFCTKDYKIPGTEFILKKGDVINVPIIGIHHDERYHPEPMKFDPERFSPENKSKLQNAFMPFGQGPRNCIGMRFALLEVKLALVRLVEKFTIEPSEKTLIPLKYVNTNSLTPVGGMWLSLRKRV